MYLSLKLKMNAENVAQVCSVQLAARGRMKDNTSGPLAHVDFWGRHHLALLRLVSKFHFQNKKKKSSSFFRDKN